ncbi:MAG: hypothetical protein Q8O83_03520 [bacterium]|nr:hypothetical protein [bacterium]
MDHKEELELYKAGEKISKLFNLDFFKKFRDVSFIDPESVFIWFPNGLGDIAIGKGSVIGPHVYLFGGISIGENTKIQPGTRITRSVIGSYCNIGGHIIDSVLGDYIETGPHTELTRCTLGEHTTAKHYCYLGDTTTGEHVNIAAGTITANFDGAPEKNKTIIGNNVKTGINSNLISTKKNNNGVLYIGDDAVIGANAVILADVPAGATIIGIHKNRKNTEVHHAKND